VHIIIPKRLLEFAQKHPDCYNPLDSWYRIMKSRNFNNFSEIREIYPSADQVKRLTVFNIGGNKARLIVAIHYKSHRIYIRNVLKHEEYNRGHWKE
jgi:mRNA interferase HigB